MFLYHYSRYWKVSDSCTYIPLPHILTDIPFPVFLRLHFTEPSLQFVTGPLFTIGFNDMHLGFPSIKFFHHLFSCKYVLFTPFSHFYFHKSSTTLSLEATEATTDDLTNIKISGYFTIMAWSSFFCRG